MKTVQEIIDDLTNTIEGKRLFWKQLDREYRLEFDPIQRAVLMATKDYLELNLTELRAIKDDLLKVSK